MVMELVKDIFDIEQLVGHNTLQTIIEGDILVPDIKPDIHRILTVEGDIHINKIEVQENRIVVGGNIRFKVLYVSEKGDELLYNIDSNTGFQEDIIIEGLNSQMKADVKAELEHIDYNLNNERKIGIKAVINLEGRGIEKTSVEFGQDIEGIDNIEVLKSDLEYNHMVISDKFNIVAHGNFELGENEEEIKEILKWDGVVLERETRLEDGKVLISGDVFLDIMYKTWDRNLNIEVLKTTIPFKHTMEIPEVYADMMYKLRMNIEDVYINVDQNLDGENKLIQIEVSMDANIVVMEKHKKAIMVDAYVPNKSIEIEKEVIKLNENMAFYSSEIFLRESVNIPSSHPPIDEVYSVVARSVPINYNLVGNRVILEGILENIIIYSSGQEKKSVYSYKEEFPFDHHMEVGEIKEDMEVDTDILVQNMDFHKINENTLELRVNLVISYEIRQKRNIEIITNAEDLGIDIDIKGRPSFTIYFIKEGDTLWDIAKKYHTRIKDIMESNNIENPQDIRVGDQIIIEKVYDFNF